MIDGNSPLEQQPLRLTSLQQSVQRLLAQKNTEKYSLSDWYVGALYAIANTNNPDRFSQAAQSFRELLEKLPRTMQGNDGRTRSKQPPKITRIQNEMERVDPMAHQLDLAIRRKKDNELLELWEVFQEIAHHNHAVAESEFNVHVESFEKIVLNLLAPVIAQDQQEIQSILNRSDLSSSDTDRLFSLIARKGANYVFFFAQLSDPKWIPILNENHYFSNLPAVQPYKEGRAHTLYWPPITYLQRVANISPQLVIDTVLSIRSTDNPLILHSIAEIALQVTPVERSLKLKEYVFDYINNPHEYPQSNTVLKLIERWGVASNDTTSATLKLIEDVVKFQPAPAMEVNPDDLTAVLEPAPRFQPYEYQEILNEGIRPLAERRPYPVARILIDAVSTMIRLKEHEANPDNEEGASEFWCSRLDGVGFVPPDSKEMLVQTLTFACQQVYEKPPESIAMLDAALSNQRWKIFKRLRQHLYALHPSEQTRPWIQQFILAHQDYAKWAHRYEFQRMIRCACEHFGVELLTEEQRTEIFDAILSGPSKASSRNRIGDNFTEDIFQQEQRIFHRRQFRPFASVLFGEHKNYFHELESESKNSIKDEDYLFSWVRGEGGTVSYRSPKSPEDLENFSDEELLAYINQWQEEHCDENDWLVKINIQALAGAFKTVFKETIIPANDRLRFWLENRDRIQRPVYLCAMVNGMEECAKEKDFKKINQWLDFCEWVLSHPSEKPLGGTRFDDESRENPNWHSSRRAVGDFVRTCLSEDMNAPISGRNQLANLLQSLCTQFDWQLDDDEPVTWNNSFANAIDTIRGRALESLVDFGFWVRRNNVEAEGTEISTILQIRLGRKAEHPLTLPEYAILGLHYYEIVSLNPKWAQAHKADFFPHDNFPAWSAAFSSFIRYGRPSAFENLKSEYVFALEHLTELMPGSQNLESPANQVVDRLGLHLFTYYRWGEYELHGNDSLLERFYQKTNNNPKYLGNFIDRVGYSVKNAGKELAKEPKNRIIKFLDWRLAEGPPEEIEGFANWLDAECLPTEYRLDAFPRILDVLKTGTRGLFSQVPALKEMLEEHPAKVIEVFARLIAAKPKNTYFYIDTDAAKAILKTGLASNDETTREHAVRAQDNLLASGRFEFMELED